MEYQRWEEVSRRAQISRRSMALAGLFVITLTLAFFVDVDGLLHFFNVLGGSAPKTLETGAMLSALSTVPFIAMGWSIGLDYDRGEHQAMAPQAH